MKYVKYIEDKLRKWQNVDLMSQIHPKEELIEANELPDQFIKHNQGKPRLSLLPPRAKALVAHVIEFGASKYGQDNWKLCKDKSLYIDAAMRHIDAYIEGEKQDKESGIDHLAHAIANLMFVMELKQ